MTETIGSDDATSLVRLVEQLRVRNAQLEHALGSRIVIEQAKGILAERYRIDVDRAFDLLRRAARSNRVKLHELAASVVASPATPTAIELELVRGRSVRGPFPTPPARGVH